MKGVWRRRYRELRGRVFAGVLRFGRWLAARCPPNVVERAGAIGGRVAWWLLAEPRRRALEHLQIAFGPDRRGEHRRIARAAFENAGRTVGEMLALGARANRLGRVVTVQGLEHFDAALARGRGLIAVAAHLGNWEMLAATMAQRGYRIAVVGRRPHETALFELLEETRRGYGVETIWRESSGSARQILRTLRAGGVVALLIDQSSASVPSVSVPFFGRPARTPAGAATLALRFQAPVLNIFIGRGSGEHVVEVRPALDPGQFTGEDAVERLTAELTRAIEEEIRRRPEEWVWWHRRWRPHEPPGADCRGPKTMVS